MLDYTRFTCPVCHKPFSQPEDVVVCPVCGAPHHRACYHALGSCAYSASHGRPDQWKPPLDKESDDVTVCGNCGTVNESGTAVCRKCGHVLQEVFPPSPGEQQPPVDASVFYAQFSPYVGIAPDSLMDGFPALDVATFLGPNAGFYLSRFHFMSLQKSRMSWNWAAALFPVLWALYRKMYRLAVLLAALTAVIAIPTVWITVLLLQHLAADPQAVQQLATGTVPSVPLSAGLLIASQLAGIAGFMLRGTMASVGNHLYHRYTIRQMTKIREACADSPQYKVILSKKGGVGLAKVLAVVVFLVILCIVAFLWIWLL